jgi:hypothetical protein
MKLSYLWFLKDTGGAFFSIQKYLNIFNLPYEYCFIFNWVSVLLFSERKRTTS